MSIKDELHSMHNAIEEFKVSFENNFGEKVTVIIGETDISGDAKVSLPVIEKITLNILKEDYPQYDQVKFLSYRTRELNYQMHLQAFCLISFIHGHNKSMIARHINKNHASVINAIKSAENYIFCKSSSFLKIHTNILKEVKNYVGISENNIETQNNTKPSILSFFPQE
tara:strand:+ start:6100 stop:6606 length:507 start_codon:yes stop_codon:yes gene_type:complete